MQKNTALDIWTELKASIPVKSERFLWVRHNDEAVRLSCKRDCAKLFGIPQQTFSDWLKKGILGILFLFIIMCAPCKLPSTKICNVMSS